MQVIEFIFWASLSLAAFTFGLYTFFTIPFWTKKSSFNSNELPSVTCVVAAFNEQDYIEQKIQNCLALSYPKDKLRFVFISDGSTDQTADLIKQHAEILALHQDARGGKTAALNRAMEYVTSEITVFSDANTELNSDALLLMVRHYQDKLVGGVSGEKKIKDKDSDAASGSGEGLYWKYETLLKKCDSRFYSLVGAPGELISIRTSLYEHIENDTILDDFMLSMRICLKGFKMVYEPKAQALEGASANITEELKRKIRICAGGFQAISRLKVNLFRNPRLFYLYTAHRVMRWAVAPYCLISLFVSSVLLMEQAPVYFVFTCLQFAFYAQVLVGFLLKDVKIRLKGFFVPYYFIVMNYAAIAGFIKYKRGLQSAAWDRSKRAE